MLVLFFTTFWAIGGPARLVVDILRIKALFLPWGGGGVIFFKGSV